MGMQGTYFLVPEEEVAKLANGRMDFFDLQPPTDASETLDIDKSWQALHYLFAGELDNGTPPLGYVIPMRDDLFLESDFELGAFYLLEEHILSAYLKIKDIQRDGFRRLYDFKALIDEEIYPFTPQDDDKKIFEYLYQNFEKIKDFYKKALDENKGIIFYIS